MAILKDLNQEQLLAEIARLKAENERLAKAGQRSLTAKISDKGAISLYGMGRFPVTLYKSQWQRLFTDEAKAKIEALYSFAKDKSDD